MFIFIDESGIHKKVDHSTFALAYVESQNYSLLEKQVQKIESKLKIDYFHWSKTAWKVKEKFIKEILKLNFKVKIAVVKNPIKTDKELEKVLTHLIIEKKIKCIYIDGKKPKWYERKIKKTLRDKGISTKKLRTVKSSQNAGVRVADMVAGLSRSYFDKKNLDRISKYYRRLQKKIIVVIK